MDANLWKLFCQEQPESVALYPGIWLHYLDVTADSFSVRRGPQQPVILIQYCRSGQMRWKMKNGNELRLGPGDFVVLSQKHWEDALLTYPEGFYAGLAITIELSEAEQNPPELLADTSLFRDLLRERFCNGKTFTVLTGSPETEGIFSCFYHQPETVLLPYQKVKVLELLLYLAKTDPGSGGASAPYRSDQERLIREIHDHLLEHMEQRITIRDLSKKYLINPTTLKDTFKAVYGMSLASHIKEHKMAYAAKMLRESDMSIGEIAQNVGYDSQSRFSDAFKACFHILPTEYRRQHRS